MLMFDLDNNKSYNRLSQNDSFTYLNSNDSSYTFSKRSSRIHATILPF